MKNLLSFLRRWSELITIPLAFLIFYLSGPFLRWVDPTAAVFDVGIFQILIVCIVTLFVFTGVTWLYMWLVFPRGKKILDDIFIYKEKLTEWERAKLAFSFFALLLLALVGIANMIA